MDLSDDAIKGYLIMGCSDNYFTPKIIAGFAKNAVFQEKAPSIEGGQDLKERNNLLSELKAYFSLEKIKPILEKLAEEGKLEKSFVSVSKGKKETEQIRYRLPADEKQKPNEKQK